MKQTIQIPDYPVENSVKVVDYRANKYLSDMQVSFHWWDAAHTSLHCHNHYEFFIITSGHTYHTLNGACRELGEHTLFLIRPQDVHQFSPVGADKCIHINVSATVERFAQLCGILGISPDALLEDKELSAALSRDETAYFMARAQQLNYLFRDDADRAVIQLTITEMLVQGLSLIYKKRRMRQDDRPLWLRDVLEQLHAPEYMGCCADDVYRLAGYSAPVVIRTFKQYTGQTVRGYLVGLKMDWAVRLFQTTDMTALEVSDALGYASLSHFGKLFAQHTGFCPRDFKARQVERA